VAFNCTYFISIETRPHDVAIGVYSTRPTIYPGQEQNGYLGKITFISLKNEIILQLLKQKSRVLEADRLCLNQVAHTLDLILAQACLLYFSKVLIYQYPE